MTEKESKGCFMRSPAKGATASLLFCLALWISTAVAYAQEAVVVISDGQIANLASACSGGAASSNCQAALKSLLATLGIANPGVPISTVVRTLASKVAEQSNANIARPGIAFDAASAAQAMSALADFATSAGLSSLANTIAAIAANVENGVKMDLTAISSGAGIAIPAKTASPG